MFPDLKSAIEALLGVNVYPLIGPQTESEFVTLQLISDPPITSGTIRTTLAAVRYQISFVSSLYSRAEEMDKALWDAWEPIRHGYIDGYPVQYVEREGVRESFDNDDGGKYRRARDYIFYCPEGAS
ncbi:hypothetical protein HV243_10575 [Citrobacter sp. RHBSTW-00599]|uniref:hypothetical protein n=1 Tax=Citrobacter sp. RHBSTW-00599 TaxID=2742657 RepID=UPI0015EAF2DB|nr:hypothetical protein [Citrobacter sp. RHBSTW-00599]QLY02890.1 hypothetical protein HV243_10575 [Citrobacter sp. RHBSTW-00599]